MYRKVDTTGTHRIDDQTAWDLTHPGALEAALTRIEQLRDTGELN